MHSESWYREEIAKLHQHVHALHHQLQSLNRYIGNKTIFEYQIKKLQIEKVKGQLQIGHLLEKELQKLEGIHRFYIEEIKITEIEGKGTVGIGAVEKGESRKAKQIVAPDEASDEIKSVYEKIFAEGQSGAGVVSEGGSEERSASSGLGVHGSAMGQF